MADLLSSEPLTDRKPGSLAKRLYAQHFEKRYGKRRTNLDRYGEHFERIEDLAAEHPGSLDRVLVYVLRSFFADDSQEAYGKHSPGTLAGKGFFRHARGYADEYEAERRVQSEREHSARELAKIQANEAQCRRERAERNGQSGPVTVAEAAAETMRSLAGNAD